MSAFAEKPSLVEPASPLSLLDYASLSMGLEVLPHRTTEVFRSFGLDAATGASAMSVWSEWLAKRPRDAAECVQMRARMRTYWVRWDAQNAAAKTPAVVEHESTPVSHCSEIRLAPVRSGLSLFDLASLSMAIEILPARREDILATFGARTEMARREATHSLAGVLASTDLDLRSWQSMRLRMRDHWLRWDAATPRKGPPRPRFRPRKSYEPPARFRSEQSEEIDVERAYVETPAPPEPSVLTLLDYARLTLEIERVSPDRVESLLRQVGLDRVSGERELSAWKRRLENSEEERFRHRRLRDELLAAAAPKRPPIGIFEYALLCVEIDLDPRNSEDIHRRIGLVDAASRESAHAYWQGRFEVDVAARTEWFSHVQRLRESTPKQG